MSRAARKAVVGRPILYKTTKDFLMRFGLKDIAELPSVEEFEKLAAETVQADLFTAGTPEPVADATGVSETAEQQPTPEPATSSDEGTS